MTTFNDDGNNALFEQELSWKVLSGAVGGLVSVFRKSVEQRSGTMLGKIPWHPHSFPRPWL